MNQSCFSILWVTPVSKQSAIGNFSRLVVMELARRGGEVTIGSCEVNAVDAASAHYTGLPTFLNSKDVLARLHDFDVVVYNIGNNYGYHGALIGMIGQRRGICIFHDLYLHDLFYHDLAARGRVSEHDPIVRGIYGGEVEFQPSETGYGSVLRHRIEHYPMTEWLAPEALGCVVHGRFGVPILERISSGPVVHVPLAYYDPASARATREKVSTPLGTRVKISTFGDVNPNKRIDSVIRAIGSSSSLRNQTKYTVVGNAAEPDQLFLCDLAGSLGVSFEMTGRAGTEDWAARLEETDIATCLRFPTTETASATAIESMLTGKPILVTDTGFYRDLPDNLVFKVDPSREVESLREQLERLVEDSDLRRRTGCKAASWAKNTFSSSQYADKIDSVCRTVLELEPALEVGFKLAQTAGVIGLFPDDEALSSWTRRAGLLLSDCRAED